MPAPPPVTLTIAGSDCSAGAGIQADLKTFQYFGTHGLTAVTCVVSETSKTVAAMQPVPTDLIVSQVSLLLKSFPIAAIKTGMLYSAEIIHAITSELSHHPHIPLIVDPVMIASTGTSLMASDALNAYQNALLPLADLITPNLPEAEILLGRALNTSADIDAAALELSSIYQSAVLIKGGHRDGPDCVDTLATNGALDHFSQKRINTPASHGTGCTLSAAITAAIAHQHPLPTAVTMAKSYLCLTLRNSYEFHTSDGTSIHPLNQATCGADFQHHNPPENGA